MKNNSLPIINIEDDKLKFTSFSSRIAHGIVNYNQEETFILSIEGEWGSGKTSLINLVKKQIMELDKDKNIIFMDFNPWLITDIEQIIKLFFDDLIKTISYESFEAKLKEDILKDLKSFASLIVPDKVNIDIGLVKLGYKPKDAFLPDNKNTLSQIKNKINGYLKKLGKKILIVIDDIDRLTDKETETIFRLTKGIADFDNLIYLLSYDKAIVSKSLETFKSENGQKYLDKIIQYPLQVPKTHDVTLKNIFIEELSKVTKIDAYYYRNILNKMISKQINTVRDINQVMNILSFEYSIVIEEVDFEDYLILTVIRVQNYDLYNKIKNQPNIFLLNNKEENIFETRLKEFNSYENLLIILFPNLSNNLSKEASHRNKKLRDKYYFENYFTFSVGDDKLSRAEYYPIRDNLILPFSESFKNLILKIKDEDKIEYFFNMFEELESVYDHIELENMVKNLLEIELILNAGKIKHEYIFLGFVSKIVLRHNKLGVFLIEYFSNENKISTNMKNYLLNKLQYNSTLPISYKELSNNVRKSNNFNQDIYKKLQLIIIEKLKDLSFDDILSRFESDGVINLFAEYNIDIKISKLYTEINNYCKSDLNRFFEILDYLKESTNSFLGKLDSPAIRILINMNDIKNTINIKSLTNEQLELLKYWGMEG